MPFNVALSGIRAANTDLDVTGNNIANASTIGFKESRAEFGDIFAGSILGSTQNTAGSGVNLLNIRQQFSQGNLDFTDNALDLAINGQGFFITSNQGDQLFTRAGAMGLDNEGFIASNSGGRIQGFAADANGNINGTLSDLQIDASTQPPRQTTVSELQVNLDSNEEVLESIGTGFTTDGAAIGVAQLGLEQATTTTLNAGPIAALPIDFNTNPTTFDITLNGALPASGNGAVSINLGASTANSVQDIANLINSKIFGAAAPINVQALADSGELRFQDLTEGVGSNISLSNITGGNALSTSLSGAPASVAGIAEVDNGYASQTLEFTNPEGDIFLFTSEEAASASRTASELNALAGVTATATTQARVLGGTFDNSNNNMTLNGVTLTATTLDGIANQINQLTTSNLPGVTAQVNAVGDLEIVSSIGADLRFGFTDAGAAGALNIIGRSGTGTQTVNNQTDAAVIGGSINIQLSEGFALADATPNVGNLFAPLTPASFTEVPINSFDPNRQETFNHSTTSTVFDSLGNSHRLEQFFVKQPFDPNDASTSPNQWKLFIQIDGQNVGDPDPSLPSPQGTEPSLVEFNINFNADGSLNQALSDPILISNWVPRDQNGDPTGALGPLNVLQGGLIPVQEPPTSSNFEVDLAGTTQFGSPFGVENQDQNGFASGRLSGLDINEEGIIFARFTNGETRTLGQVALANFNNVEGLRPVGDTQWAQSSDTGEPTIGGPGTASLGTVTAGALEESNVDLSEQLVNLIIAQRNFQASSRTIETANTITQTIINIR